MNQRDHEFLPLIYILMNDPPVGDGWCSSFAEEFFLGMEDLFLGIEEILLGIEEILLAEEDLFE